MIKVHWEGEDFPLQIPVSATIMQVKLQISQQLGIIAIPADRQELCLENGTGLSDEMTLEYYGISHGSVLTVLQKIRVTIRMANNHFLGLIVSEDITVGTLKDYLRDQHGMDIENKALEMEYEGKLVALDDRTYLWAAGIVEGTALSLVRA